ncbi:MAG: sel1 repeat family protein [Kiritimatiellae bacterium]|nr:sel1 repeat family protein [Kiritimatiellia bacterium]
MGAFVGGIAGAVVGEIFGAKGGEWAYLAKAERGAERGDPAADFFLGGYHYSRIKPGKAKHVAEARLHLERAVAAGSAKAGVFLGKMLWDGIGRPADKAGAVALWRTAAERGDADGMYLLARALLAGEGAETDIETGHSLMRESAARGCELAIDAYPETDRLYQAWRAESAERAPSTGPSAGAARPAPSPAAFQAVRPSRNPHGRPSGWLRPACRLPRTRVC